MCYSVTNVIDSKIAGGEENRKTRSSIVIKVSTATILENDKEAI